LCTSEASEASTDAEMPTFSHLELAKVMKENSYSFTDTSNQTKSVRDHILSGLTLTVENHNDNLEELEEGVKKFVSKTASKYKGHHRSYENFRADFFGNKEEQFFEVPFSVIEKRYKKLQTAAADPKKKLDQAEISLPAEKAKRITKPFAEKSKWAQYAAAKQVRDTHEAPAILLAAAQSQSLAGKKDASFVMWLEDWSHCSQSQSCNCEAS
jgi:hypothetical protein